VQKAASFERSNVHPIALADMATAEMHWRAVRMRGPHRARPLTLLSCRA
jgi:hypothetical protein